jgi:competence protein ComEA
MKPLVWKVINLEVPDRTTGFLVLLLTLLIFFALNPPLLRPSHNRSEGEERVFVQVDGDVKFPGVYAFGHRPNPAELVSRAGRLSSGKVSFETLKDFTFANGMKALIAWHGEEFGFHQTEMSAFYKTTLGIPISLNEESEMGLTAIPGIGPGLAKAIVQDRTRRGGFKSLDDIQSVDGVSQKLYMKIRPHLEL